MKTVLVLSFFLLLSVDAHAADIVRKTSVVRGEDYMQSTFLKDNKPIASLKTNVDGNYDAKGTIPDGKVLFENSYNKTHGEEYYRDGKKHGRSRTYYASGELAAEAEYQYGKLIRETQYYKDGGKRFEVDYSNARDWGKLYYHNGKLKYEWNITTSLARGYKKAYNTDGSLRYTAYYDEKGHITQEIKEPPAS